MSITPLVLTQLPIRRAGLTDFTYSRYLVPYLSGYDGWSVFMDADMICLTDIYEILEHRNEQCSVHVVKSPLRYEWPSLMLFNNKWCKRLTPDYIEKGKPQTFEWAYQVGGLPKEWNHLVGYDDPSDAKVIHFTQGIPVFPETQKSEHAEKWHEERRHAMMTCSWSEIMGDSVHAQHIKAANANQ